MRLAGLCGPMESCFQFPCEAQECHFRPPLLSSVPFNPQHLDPYQGAVMLGDLRWFTGNGRETLQRSILYLLCWTFGLKARFVL